MDRENIKKLYTERFSGDEIVTKNRIWSVLCRAFFSRFIRDDHVIVDIGAGYCEFLNNIRASGKLAIDINPDTPKFAGPDVRVISDDCRNIVSIEDGTIDVVFSSNFLEHLNDKNDVLQTLQEAFRILKKGGLVILMGPNIRHLYAEYWDFFDHRVPLSDRSLCEILSTIGFSLKKVYGKFLPYTTKTRAPKFPLLIRLYLAVPLFYRIFGKQFLIVGQK
jgi:SAM-dependent methyltransferase